MIYGILFFIAAIAVTRALVIPKRHIIWPPRPVNITSDITTQVPSPPLYTMVTMPDGTQQMIQVSQTSGAGGLTPGDTSAKHKVNGVVLLVAGVGVFILCCIIQAACGSSMFSGTYYPSSGFSDMLVEFTWYPGWVLSLVLVASGGVRLLLSLLSK